jgi:hypothetical protein
MEQWLNSDQQGNIEETGKNTCFSASCSTMNLLGLKPGFNIEKLGITGRAMERLCQILTPYATKYLNKLMLFNVTNSAILRSVYSTSFSDELNCLRGLLFDTVSIASDGRMIDGLMNWKGFGRKR